MIFGIVCLLLIIMIVYWFFAVFVGLTSMVWLYLIGIAVGFAIRGAMD